MPPAELVPDAPGAPPPGAPQPKALAAGDDAAEFSRLRESMHDLVTLLALPAIWSGRPPGAILSSAVEMLSSLARLDVIYARLAPRDGHREEAVYLQGITSSEGKAVLACREGMGALLDNPGIGFCDLPGSGRVQLLVAELGFYGGTGLIAFGARRAGFPDRAESMLLRTAANLLATAVQGARLLEETQAARTRASFLAEVSAALTGSAQHDDALINCSARVAAARVAQVCAVDLVQPSTGRIATATVVHRDVHHTPEAQQRHASASSRAAVEQVIRSGAARLASGGLEPASDRLAVVVPILASRGVLGAITLTSGDDRARFEAADLEMAEDFGRRLGASLEAAGLAREARDADRRKDEFLAMLAHELRNPLAPILAAMHLLRMRSAIPAREQQIIERQVRHMVRLVDDLLDISRITRGIIELTLETLQVADVLAAAVEIASPLIDKAGHQLSIQIDPAAEAVTGDAVRLAQIFANLLTNAAKYSPAGSAIAVHAAAASGMIEISVRDTGIGIPAELIPKVFDLFVQGARGLDRAQGGLGIGLTLVRRLAERHGGTVSVNSDGPGRGSEFVVRLPAPEVLFGGSAAVLPLPSHRASGRVLVVDDNTDAAEMLGEMLRSAGYTVSLAADGPQALLLAATFQPDTAVVDIGLPLMDGYQVAKRLRLLAGLERLRLVALSGYGQASDRARCLAAGFDLHLVKPAELEAILEAVVPSARE